MLCRTPGKTDSHHPVRTHAFPPMVRRLRKGCLDPTIHAEVAGGEPIVNCVIVHERDSVWTSGLRRCLPTDANVTILRVTSTTAVREKLQREPASVLIWEAAGGSAEFPLGIFPKLKADFPEAVFIVATDDDDPSHAAYYEAGATLVATCPWKFNQATRVIHKHFARRPPKPETTREKVWNALPWQENHFEK